MFVAQVQASLRDANPFFTRIQPLKRLAKFVRRYATKIPRGLKVANLKIDSGTFCLFKRI
jgi:hypothetical protein